MNDETTASSIMQAQNSTEIEETKKGLKTKKEQGSGSSKSKGKGGAPKGNNNAAKVGQDLRAEIYLSKVRRGFFEEFFSLRFGRPAYDEEELRDFFRQLAYAAVDHEMAEEFERHQPGRVSGSSGETF